MKKEKQNKCNKFQDNFSSKLLVDSFLNWIYVQSLPNLSQIKFFKRNLKLSTANLSKSKTSQHMLKNAKTCQKKNFPQYLLSVKNCQSPVNIAFIVQ